MELMVCLDAREDQDLLETPDTPDLMDSQENTLTVPPERMVPQEKTERTDSTEDVDFPETVE